MNMERNRKMQQNHKVTASAGRLTLTYGDGMQLKSECQRRKMKIEKKNVNSVVKTYKYAT